MLGFSPISSGPLSALPESPPSGIITFAPSTQANTCSSVSIGPSAAARYARPVSDVSAGPWLPSSGSSLAAMIDEPSADSSDFIYTTTPSMPAEVLLNPVVDPNTSSGQVVRFQAWDSAGGGVLVQLKQGATVIAAWSVAPLPATPTVYARALSALECDALVAVGGVISDLRFTFTAI